MMSQSLFDFSADDISGQTVSLEDYREHVVLVVNTASKCGFTPQYQGLEELHQEFGDKGLAVLGFPCNQFGNQEPGSNDDVAQFCEINYGVTFPMFAKVDVNGNDAHPLFQWLKKQTPGLLGSEGVKWNFTKFLVDKDGQPVKRFAPTTKPEELRDRIAKML